MQICKSAKRAREMQACSERSWLEPDSAKCLRLRSHAAAAWRSGNVLHLRVEGAAHLQLIVAVLTGWLQRMLAVAAPSRLVTSTVRCVSRLIPR